MTPTRLRRDIGHSPITVSLLRFDLRIFDVHHRLSALASAAAIALGSRLSPAARLKALSLPAPSTQPARRIRWHPEVRTCALTGVKTERQSREIHTNQSALDVSIVFVYRSILTLSPT
jgi:hypothetical protein